MKDVGYVGGSTATPPQRTPTSSGSDDQGYFLVWDLTLCFQPSLVPLKHLQLVALLYEEVNLSQRHGI